MSTATTVPPLKRRSVLPLVTKAQRASGETTTPVGKKHVSAGGLRPSSLPVHAPRRRVQKSRRIIDLELDTDTITWVAWPIEPALRRPVPYIRGKASRKHSPARVGDRRRSTADPRH